MKVCPSCARRYADEKLSFCRKDGTKLVNITEGPSENQTERLGAKYQAAATRLIEQTPPTQAGLVTTPRRPETKYAKSGDINIAYQILGDGPIDLVYVPGWVSHLEYGWEQPLLARFYERLASFSRLILFDKRGTGLSDQTIEPPSLEQRMDDVRAVMEAAGSERAVVFGMSEGGNMSILFAATYPERTRALITFGVFARRIWAPDYIWAPTPEERQKFYDAIEREWGGPIRIEELGPSVARDQVFRHWWATYQRHSASPGAALALARMNTLIDIRNVLPAIRVPTLILHRSGDKVSNIEEGKYLEARIPGAKFVELPGDDHLVFVGDQETLFSEIESFLNGITDTQEKDTVLGTFIYTRLISSDSNTPKEATKQFRLVAKREAEWFRGRAGLPRGDSFIALFDGPVRAIRSACAIRESLRPAGLQVKTGIHTGICEVKGKHFEGAAVLISQLISAEARADEIVISNAVKDLVSGSGLQFEARSDLRVVEAPIALQLFSVK